MSVVAIEFGFGGRCRGMLAGPPQGATFAAYGPPEGRHGGDHIPSKGFPAGTENVDIAGGAGTSRSQGRGSKGGRHRVEESSSESD